MSLAMFIVNDSLNPVAIGTQQLELLSSCTWVSSNQSPGVQVAVSTTIIRVFSAVSIAVVNLKRSPIFKSTMGALVTKKVEDFSPNGVSPSGFNCIMFGAVFFPPFARPFSSFLSCIFRMCQTPFFAIGAHSYHSIFVFHCNSIQLWEW